MAKKKEQKPPTPAIETELAGVEKGIQREIAVVKAVPVIKRVFFFIWIALDVILLILFFSTVIYYLFAGSFNERRQVSQIAQNISSIHSTTVSNAAQDISISTSNVFSVSGNEYDFYAQMNNPNEDWYATFNYFFSTSQGDSEQLRGFILPSEERPLVVFKQRFEGRPTDVELTIVDLVWHRVDHHQIADPLAWIEDRKGLNISNQSYSQEVQLDEATFARSSFTITNTSAYSYWSPDFYILLERSGSLVGVNKVNVTNLMAGESRSVDVNWFGSAPISASVRVVPNINYFDDSVYMPPAGEFQLDIRDVRR